MTMFTFLGGSSSDLTHHSHNGKAIESPNNNNNNTQSPQQKRRSIIHSPKSNTSRITGSPGRTTMPSSSSSRPTCTSSPTFLPRCFSNSFLLAPLSPSRTSSMAHANIVDEIRNDEELFFADDDDDDNDGDGGADADGAADNDNNNPCTVIGALSHSTSLVFADQFSLPPSSVDITDAHSQLNLRRHSIHSTAAAASRRSSQQSRICDLQREVDEALELFSGSFDIDDNDDYPNYEDDEEGGEYEPIMSSHLDKKMNHCGIHSSGHHHDQHQHQQQQQQRFTTSHNSEEEYDSFPGTAATSLATSSDCGDQSSGENDPHSHSEPRMSSFSNNSIHGVTTNGGYTGYGSNTYNSTNNYGGGGLSYKHKTKSILSLPLSLLPSKTQMNCLEQEEDTSIKFETVIGEELVALGVSEEQKKDCNFYVDFNHSCLSLRNTMEPFLAVARLRREEARQQVFNTIHELIPPQAMRRASLDCAASFEQSFHIGSTYGVPYPALRAERPFLYDNDSYPLDMVLAETLGVSDLSKLHLDYPSSQQDKVRLMAPLQNRGKRRAFHRCFDSFVTSHVIPLLHSQALANGVFHTNHHQLRKGKPQRIVYRYQAFPCIRIIRPGECSVGPHCDMADGHSIGNINFHIPLTSTFGTNALYVESYPGREDWHPLLAKSGPGLGFQFDGARCLHFTLNNESDCTRVSLDFRIAITRASEDGTTPTMSASSPYSYSVGGGDAVDYDPDDQLCCPQLLTDEYSHGGPGYYDEVVVNVGDVPRSFLPGPVATKRPSSVNKLYDPDERVGFPFSIASNCCNQR